MIPKISNIEISFKFSYTGQGHFFGCIKPKNQSVEDIIKNEIMEVILGVDSKICTDKLLIIKSKETINENQQHPDSTNPA